jgi:hypothetical protein
LLSGNYSGVFRRKGTSASCRRARSISLSAVTSRVRHRPCGAMPPGRCESSIRRRESWNRFIASIGSVPAGNPASVAMEAPPALSRGIARWRDRYGQDGLFPGFLFSLIPIPISFHTVLSDSTEPSARTSAFSAFMPADAGASSTLVNGFLWSDWKHPVLSTFHAVHRKSSFDFPRTTDNNQ